MLEKISEKFYILLDITMYDWIILNLRFALYKITGKSSIPIVPAIYFELIHELWDMFTLLKLMTSQTFKFKFWKKIITSFTTHNTD